MKHAIFAFGLVLSVLVSACDSQGINEPVQGPATDNINALAPDPGAEQSVFFERFVSEMEGPGKLYVASGYIAYTIVEQFTTRGNDGPCQNFVLSSVVDGAISLYPRDERLWSFQDANEVTICVAGNGSTLDLLCPIVGREDGATLHLQLSVSASGVELSDLWIEAPEIAPGSDAKVTSAQR